MTKKDYIIIANAIKQTDLEDSTRPAWRTEFIFWLCVAMKNDNPKFDKVKFEKFIK